MVRNLVSIAAPVIIEAAREGIPSEAARARLAGITGQTLKNWMEKGRTSTRPEDEKYRELVADVERAEAEFVQGRLRNIIKAGEKDAHWTANAWLLERRFPEYFAKRPAEIEVKISKSYTFQEPPVPVPEAREVEVDEIRDAGVESQNGVHEDE